MLSQFKGQSRPFDEVQNIFFIAQVVSYFVRPKVTKFCSAEGTSCPQHCRRHPCRHPLANRGIYHIFGLLFMNIVLLDPRQTQSEIWTISAKRQLEHLQTHLDIQVGDTLKVGIREGKRYLTEIVEISEKSVQLKPLQEEAVPEKLPVTLIVALPRPKVLRRLIMDAVTMGVKIILLHSYRVDKSYWQTPFCSSWIIMLNWA